MESARKITAPRRTERTGIAWALESVRGKVRDLVQRVWVRSRSVVDRWLFIGRFRWQLLASLVATAGSFSLGQTLLSWFFTLLSTSLFIADWFAVSARTALPSYVDRPAEWFEQFLREAPEDRVWTAGSSVLLMECIGEAEVREAFDRPAGTVARYRVPQILTTIAESVISNHHNRQTIVNRQLVALASDPGEDVVRLREARYFDHLVSNFALRRRISVNGGPDLGRDLIVDGMGRLRRIADSSLANVIGVSVVAVNDDNEVLAVLPTAHTVGSPWTLHPAGSGSVEWKDLPENQSMCDMLRAAMLRELLEESGLEPDRVGAITLLGYGRWLDQGAKPEFFGVCRVRVAANEIEGLLRRGEEPVFTAGAKLLEVDLTHDSITFDPDQKILPGPALRRVGMRYSVPLLVGLALYARFLPGLVLSAPGTSTST